MPGTGKFDHSGCKLLYDRITPGVGDAHSTGHTLDSINFNEYRYFSGNRLIILAIVLASTQMLSWYSSLNAHNSIAEGEEPGELHCPKKAQTGMVITKYLPLRMSKVRTVPSTQPATISVLVTTTDVTLSPNVSIVCQQIKTLSIHVNLYYSSQKEDHIRLLTSVQALTAYLTHATLILEAQKEFST